MIKFNCVQNLRLYKTSIIFISRSMCASGTENYSDIIQIVVLDVTKGLLLIKIIATILAVTSVMNVYIVLGQRSRLSLVMTYHCVWINVT